MGQRAGREDAASQTGCSCAAPAREGEAIPSVEVVGAGEHLVEQVWVPGGSFSMGDSSGDGIAADGELPLHDVLLDGFHIDATTVTNDDFARFVDATGFRTDAERYGFSAVFHLAVAADEADIFSAAMGTPWWWGVKGADWRHPGGLKSDLDGRGDHPVVHISWDDAMAYCRWAGRRLPTEAEWEYSARGGLQHAKFPWGDEPVNDGGWRANIWQGTFPEVNLEEDGYLTTAPVRSYRPNDYGLWQSIGNVWEWCADWFSPHYYRESPQENPIGPANGATRVLRGGSYLCHDSYCNRYRNSARSNNSPESSMGNAGFRTVSLREG